MKTTYQMRRGFTLVELLVVIVIIAALAGLTAPMVIRQRKKADQTEAVSNARQIGFAMLEFESEYGSFPDPTLGALINTNVGGLVASPVAFTSSNDAFTQLIASGIATTEQMFYCKTAYSKVKPDNVTSTVADVLKAGEVGFGYVTGTGNAAYNSAGNSGRVLAVAPLKFPFAPGDFDKDAYDSKAVILKMDNSVTSIPINATGKAVLGGTKLLLDVGADTVWGTGVVPIILNPL